MKMRSQRPFLIIAAPLIIGSVVVAGAQNEAKNQDRIGASSPQGADVASQLAAYPIDHFHVTAERPLFAPSRRPPPPPPIMIPPPPPPPTPPNVTLLGVVIDGGVARAIIQAAPENMIRRVRTGDYVGGWTVSQIAARRLVLKLDDREASFTMFTGPVEQPGGPTGPVEQPRGRPPPYARSPRHGD